MEDTKRSGPSKQGVYLLMRERHKCKNQRAMPLYSSCDSALDSGALCSHQGDKGRTTFACSLFVGLVEYSSGSVLLSLELQ